MAELKELLASIVKYGGYPILLIWVWKLDADQKEIKSKMFECFDDKEDILKNKISRNDNKTLYIKPYLVAVLPSKENKKQDEYRRN